MVNDVGGGEAVTVMLSVAVTVAPLSVKLAVMVTCESVATLPAVITPAALTVATEGLLLLQEGVTDLSAPSVYLALAEAPTVLEPFNVEGPKIVTDVGLKDDATLKPPWPSAATTDSGV